MAAILRKPAVVASEEIKCTNCGVGIEISRAANHVCRTASPGPMHPMDRFNQAFSSMKHKTNAPFPFDIRPKPSTSTTLNAAATNRPPQPSPLAPPAANPPSDRPFLPRPSSPQGPPPRLERALTPGPLASSASRSGAPSPFVMPPRAATASPRPPLRAPSPDRVLPQDCAFPPFPLLQRRKSSGRGALEPSRSGTPITRTEPDPPRATSPPHTLGLPPGLRPMNQEARPETPQQHERDLSLYSEDSVGAGGSTNSSPRSRAETPSDTGSAPPIPPISGRRKLSSPGRPETMRIPFTSSPYEEQEKELHISPGPSPEPPLTSPNRSLGHFRKPSMSAASRPLHEIGCIKTHRPALSRSGSQRRVGHDLSAPLSAKVVNERSDSRLENAPPVPAQRFLQEHALRSESDVYGNHSHSPTDSISSNGSSAQTNSSRSSPPTSALSLAPGHRPFESIEGKPGDLGHTKTTDLWSGPRSGGFKSRAPPPLQIRDGIRDLVPAPLSARTAPNPGLPAPLSPRRDQTPLGTPLQQVFEDTRRSVTAQDHLPPLRSPLQQEFNHPGPNVQQEYHEPYLPQQNDFDQTLPEDSGVNHSPNAPSQAVPRRRPIKSFSRPSYYRPMGVVEPESPMDPGLQNGRLPALNINTGAPPLQPRWEMPPKTAPLPASRPDWAPPALRSPQTAPAFGMGEFSSRHEAFPPRNESINQHQRFHTPNPMLPESALRRAATSRRAPCRGCHQYIHGKSVSSADGQLTGRWHRSCFVCRTCSSPFASSDFYVFQDHPYCARHYHQLNHTLCCACDRGIEGPYVETDARVKFHPHCFTCRECHLILRDVHFEDPTSGAVLCERHAMESWRRQFGQDGGLGSGLGGGSRFPERRTTRLMMV